MDNLTELDLLGKVTHKGPLSAAEFLVAELRDGATILGVCPHAGGESTIFLRRPEGRDYPVLLKSWGIVIGLIHGSDGFTYHVRLNLAELSPEQLLVYAPARAGQSVRRRGPRRRNEERDAAIRVAVAIYSAQGHPLEESDYNTSAFEMAAQQLGEEFSVVRKVWKKCTVKEQLKKAATDP